MNRKFDSEALQSLQTDKEGAHTKFITFYGVAIVADRVACDFYCILTEATDKDHELKWCAQQGGITEAGWKGQKGGKRLIFVL